MGSTNDPPMLANDLTFGDNDNAVRVNMEADRPIGEGGRHTVAIALKVNGFEEDRRGEKTRGCATA